MKVEVSVTGDREVQRALERQGKAGELAARRTFNKILRRIVPLARALAPVGPGGGGLQKSIRISSARLNKRTGEIFGFIVAGGAPLTKGGSSGIYALPQEAGTARVGTGGQAVQLHHRTGQSPFLLPPFLSQASNASGELLDALHEDVHRAF